MRQVQNNRYFFIGEVYFFSGKRNAIIETKTIGWIKKIFH